MDKFDLQDQAHIQDWQTLSEPRIKEDILKDDLDSAPEIKHAKHPVLMLQLVIAICALLFLFVLKFFGTSVYDVVMNKYNELLSTSVIYSGDSGNLNFLMSGATSDEV